MERYTQDLSLLVKQIQLLEEQQQQQITTISSARIQIHYSKSFEIISDTQHNRVPFLNPPFEDFRKAFVL